MSRDILHQAAPGTMIHGWRDGLVVLRIWDAGAQWQALGGAPTAQIRTGLIVFEGAGAVPVVVRVVGDHGVRYYASLVDCDNPVLEALAHQPEVQVQLVDEWGPLRVLNISPHNPDTFGWLVTETRRLALPSDAGACQGLYPHAYSLWERLDPGRVGAELVH